MFPELDIVTEVGALHEIIAIWQWTGKVVQANNFVSRFDKGYVSK
jgi:hypothetical protein